METGKRILWGLCLLTGLTLGCAGGAPESDRQVEKQDTSKVTEVTKERGIWIMEPGEALDRMIKKSEQPVVVQCYTPWCGKCRTLTPIIERLAWEFEGDVNFVKVNTADEDEFIDRYGVDGVPLVLFFTDGKEADRLMGDIDETQLRTVLDEMM